MIMVITMDKHNERLAVSLVKVYRNKNRHKYLAKLTIYGLRAHWEL